MRVGVVSTATGVGYDECRSVRIYMYVRRRGKEKGRVIIPTARQFNQFICLIVLDRISVMLQGKEKLRENL